MNKRFVKIFCIILSVACLVLCFLEVSAVVLKYELISCKSCTKKPNPNDWHTVSIYESKYTEETHIQRISEKLEERNVKNFEVYMLYSFNNVPLYFLVQLYSALYSKNEIKYEHSTFYVGYIENDEYYIPRTELGGVMDGENYYSKAGVINSKKYFAPTKQFAWDINGKIYGYEVQIEGNIHPYVSENIVELSNLLIEEGKKPLSVWKKGISKL